MGCFEAEDEIIELRGAMADVIRKVQVITRPLHRVRFGEGA